MNNASKIALSVFIGALVGAFIVAFWADRNYSGQLDRLDRQLGDALDENRRLGELNRELESTKTGLIESNNQLRADNIKAVGTINSIGSTIDRISSASGDIKAGLRAVIDTLKAIRDMVNDSRGE